MSTRSSDSIASTILNVSPPKVLVSPDKSSPSLSSSEDVVICGVIGPAEIGDMQPCPCCNRRLHGNISSSRASTNQAEVRQTLDEPAGPSRREDIPCLFHSDEGLEEEEDDYLPGVLDSGVEYRFKRILAEGWLNKKGSGNDMFGSRAWKARWARLVLAKVDGYGDVDVPLLQIYWFRSSPTPSTVIRLDSTVVIPVDKDESKTCHAYRFDVVHAREDESSTKTTRTFSVPKKGRDQWVYAINSALLKYEKDSAQAKREAAALADLKPVHTLSPLYGDILEGESFRSISDAMTRPISPPPPLSPSAGPLSPKRPLPRPDQLLGESLLGSEPLIGETLLD